MGFIKLVIANIKDKFRDGMALFWFIAFPLIFILIFGAIFGGDTFEEHKHEVGLVLETTGPMGQRMKAVFKSIDAFELFTGTKEAELNALKKGERLIVVVIPADLESNLLLEKPTRIQIHYDPGKMTTNQVLISSVRQILSEFERRMKNFPRLFETALVETSVIKLKRLDYQLPGILGMALMQLGFFGTFYFVSLRERKIIRRLNTTPLSPHMLLWSEIVVRLGMAVMQTCLIVLVGRLVFGFRMVGDPLVILATVILGSTVFISLGYFLINFTKTEESAQGLIQVVQFPMMFLSGIFFPIEIMPPFLRPITNILPLTYLGDALRHVMSGMPSVFGIGTDIAVLCAWLVGTFALSVRFLRWE